MPEEKTKSLKQVAQGLRDEYDIPDSMADSELLKRYFNKHPEALKEVQTSTPIQSTRGDKEGFIKALGSDIVGAAKSNIDPMIGSALGPLGVGDQEGRTHVGKNWGAVLPPNVGGSNDPRQTSAGDVGLGMLNLPAISKAEQNKDWGGAVGHAVLPAVTLASMARGGLKSPKAGSEMEKFSALTDKITAPIQETLNTQGEAIKSAMQGQLSNVAALRGTPVFRKLISRLQDMEHLPNTKVSDVSAAREALEEMQKQVNSGKATSWNDLFELNKRLKAAGAAIKDPSVTGAIRKITDTVNDELSTGAKNAGVGKHYDAWQEDYGKYRDLRRRYDETLSGKTDVQKEVKQTAKSNRKQVLGTSVGSPKANKVAKVGGKLIKQSHKAFDELHNQIKGRPVAKPPAPPQPAPTQTPPLIAGKMSERGSLSLKPNKDIRYGIYDKKGNLIGDYNSLKRASRKADKLDQAYGATVHSVKRLPDNPVNVPQSFPDNTPTAKPTSFTGAPMTGLAPPKGGTTEMFMKDLNKVKLPPKDVF